MKGSGPSERILLVVPFTFPEYSGSGLNAYHFARFLVREKIQAGILSFNRNLRFQAKEILDGVTIRRIAYFNRSKLTKALSLLFILPIALSRILKNDIILLYGAHIAYYPLWICLGRIFRRKVVFQSLLLGADDLETLVKRTGFGRGIFRPGAWFRRISLYHAINPLFAEKFRKHLGTSVKILECPQGFDPVHFYPVPDEEKNKLRRKIGILQGRLILLCIGFVLARKGYRELFDLLSGGNMDFHLYIIGEYEFPESHFLHPFAEEAKGIVEYGKKILGGKIDFLGPRRNIPDYMQSADLFLLSSHQEGLPNVLLEAMGCGCAVISRDLPGLEGYILEHGVTGMIYRHGEDFQAIVQQLAENEDLRKIIGRNAADFALKTASFGAVWSALRGSLFNPGASNE